MEFKMCCSSEFPDYNRVVVGNTIHYVPDPSVIKSHEKAVSFVSNIRSYHRLPEISEKQLVRIINLLVKDTFNSRVYLQQLEKLEKCFEKSKKFTLEKATKIFLSHIQQLQKENIFDVNKPFQIKQHRDSSISEITPVGFAAMNKAPALLTALIKAGGNVDEGQIGSELASPFHLVLLNSDLHENHNDLPPEYLEFVGTSFFYSFPKLQAQCIDVLHQYGCNPNSICKTELIHYRYDSHIQSETTPLWGAMLKFNRDQPGGEKELISLVNAKADINFKNNGLTPLQYAVYYMHTLERVEHLVELGADIFTTTDEISFDALEGRKWVNKRVNELTVLDLSRNPNITRGRPLYDYDRETNKYLAILMEANLPGYQLKTRAQLLTVANLPDVLVNIVMSYLWKMPNDTCEESLDNLDQRVTVIDEDEMLV